MKLNPYWLPGKAFSRANTTFSNFSQAKITQKVKIQLFTAFLKLASFLRILFVFQFYGKLGSPQTATPQ